MTEPKITAIVPAYNIADWLPRCVESLLGQDFSDLEVILVDDGSTDATGQICDGYATRDSRVRVIRQKNGGLAAARNAGLAAASGTYFCFVDGDDELLSGALQALWEIVRIHQPDLIRFGFEKVQGGKTLERRLLPYARGLYQAESLTALRLDAVSYRGVLDYTIPRLMSACTNLYRRELLNVPGIFFRSEREILNEDYLFVMQAMWAAESVYILPQTLYRYMTRQGSLTRGPRPEMYRRKRRLFAAYEASLPRDDPETALRLRNFYIDCMYNCVTEACRAMNPAQAHREISQVLADEFLQRCLVENQYLAGSAKTRCICFLMRHRLAGTMQVLYRLLAGQENGNETGKRSH